MQRSRTSLMMMIVCLVTLPFLRIPLAEGIKCHQCFGCQEHEGIVRDCLKDQVGDTCFEKVDLDSTYKRIDHYRGCVFSDRVESEKKKRGLICSDTYQQSDDHWIIGLSKLCYCSTDLCNFEQLTIHDNGDGSEGAVLTPEEVLACSGSSVITGFSSRRQIFSGLVAYFLFKRFFQ